MPIRTRKVPAVRLDPAAAPGGRTCPACGGPLFAWIEAPASDPSDRRRYLVDSCERCGLAVNRTAAGAVDHSGVDHLRRLARELAPGAELRLRFANRRSLQAALGSDSWAALDLPATTLHPSPQALELILREQGLEKPALRQLAAPGMAAMWQTLLNLLTFNPNFARAALGGRLRPAGGRGRAAFAIDALISVLVAIPVAGIAVLLEAAAIAVGRGGAIELVARRPDRAP